MHIMITIIDGLSASSVMHAGLGFDSLVGHGSFSTPVLYVVVRLFTLEAQILMQTMNSPEPGSPTYSTPSSESPPPEEANYQPPQNAAQLAQLATQVTAGLSNSGNVGSPIGTGPIGTGPSASGSNSAATIVSSSKRRQPYNVSARDRDVKTRRREPRAGGSVGTWESQGGKEGGRKDKEEFIDAHVVDKLRKGSSSSKRLLIIQDSDSCTFLNTDIGDPFLELEA